MDDRTHYAGIDYFRVAASFAVIAIHTAPLSCCNETADYLLTYCIGRLAVPFFLTATGFFTVGPSLEEGGGVLFRRCLYKLLRIYALATLLYLPLNLYAGELPDSFASLLRILLFDGTFYHLWYLPAAILGCVLVRLLVKHLSWKRTVLIVGIAYGIGLFGDSFYGLIPSWLLGLYDLFFRISSYTRNGIFFAPAFLLIGVALRRCRASHSSFFPLIFSLILLLVEGYMTWSLNLQRHNSFYVSLIPCSYYLFRMLLLLPGHAPASIRDMSLWIYLLHPLSIALLLVISKAAGAGDLFVQHSMLHFLAVSAVTFLLSAWLTRLKTRKNPQKCSDPASIPLGRTLS